MALKFHIVKSSALIALLHKLPDCRHLNLKEYSFVTDPANNKKPLEPSRPLHQTKSRSKSQSSDSKYKTPIIIVIGIAFTIALYLSRSWLSLETLAAQESKLQSLLASNPLLVLSAAFGIYVIVTALSIPGAAVLSLTYAWFFKFWTGLVLISFASTTGATIAFLISRYLLRDWVQRRFGQRLQKIDDSFEREGAFYLFTMRLIPAMPFFLINLLMGLTKIKTATFWWVSQLGMLAGTIVYVYAGASIPDLNTLQNQGVSAIFSPWQLTQISIAFLTLGLFPITAKKLLTAFGRQPKPTSSEQ